MLEKTPGAPCRPARTLPGAVVLRCESRRFEAKVAPGAKKGHFDLEVAELRGVPGGAGDEAVPSFYYLTPPSGRGGPCPAKSPAGQVECELAEGHVAVAAPMLRKLLRSSPSYAALRLGDLALREGERATAAAWYQRAVGTDPFARLAAARECELTGSCLQTRLAETFSSADLPEPARTEMDLRYARVLLLLGQVPDAAATLARRLADDARPPACGEAPLFCRRMALSALQDPAAGTSALELYLVLPQRLQGPLALELGEAAAEAAARSGAPRFGANLLASVEGLAAPAARDGLLARTAELYLAAGEPVRASVIFEYVRTRLSKKALQAPRWRAIAEALAAVPRAEASAPSVPEAAADLARAEQTVAAARALRAQESP
ncbi:MAG: hypothetical protein QM765_39260 [Myxococcales bacterium]